MNFASARFPHRLLSVVALLAATLAFPGSVQAATLYVSTSGTPVPPYATWATSATNIQDAVDATVAGDVVLVSNGVYAAGGRALPGMALTNRACIDRAIMVRSVNGAAVTAIYGQGVWGGNGIARCVYLTNGASLVGFMLTNGVTSSFGPVDDWEGGGVFCEASDSTLSNCVIVGNKAYEGGGVSGGTLYNCMLAGNSVGGSYGGAAGSILYNCVLKGNDGLDSGGGAGESTLYNCTVVGNIAGEGGGCIASSLTNCIVYENTAGYSNNFSRSDMSFSCTTPDPGGLGNITNDPVFVDFAMMDLHLQVTSPCINAGTNQSWMAGGTDLDGNPRTADGTVDMGAYEYTTAGSGPVTVSPSNGPYAAGNTITITDGMLGNGSDITNVLLGGVSATITGQGTNWVTVTVPATGSAGTKDVVIQSTSVGRTSFVGAYTVNPAGEIGGVVEDWTQWEEVAGLPSARKYLSAGVLNGALYTVGGYGDSTIESNVYRYDETNWTEVAGLPAARYGSAAGVMNGALYAVGGYSSVDFNGQTNVYRFDGTSWTEVAGLPARRHEVAGGVLNGVLHAMGGWDSSGIPRDEVYRYDGTNWTGVAAMPAARGGLAAAVLNGSLYAIGGADGSSYASSVYQFDGTYWLAVGGLPEARGYLAAGVLRGALYAIGGYNADGFPTTNVYRYNETNWTEVAGLPAARYGLAAAVLNDTLYAVGGADFGGERTNAYRYPRRVVDPGVSPSSGSVTGGYPVVVTGTALGNGADITNVTLCGVVAASIVSQSATQVVVTASVADPGLGDVAIYSTSHGTTVGAAAFTYQAERPVVNNSGGVTGVTSTAATLQGDLVFDGGTSTIVRIYWGPADAGTNAGDWATNVNVGASGTGVFSVAVSGLTGGASYVYRSWASNSVGVSWAPSSTHFVTLVALGAPSFLSATDGAYTDRVDLTWGSVTGAVAYQVWRGTTTNPAAATHISFYADPTTNSYSDTDVVPLQRYAYWVRATAGTNVGPAGVQDWGFTAIGVSHFFYEAYSTNGTGTRQIWRCRADGSDERALFSDTLSRRRPTVSPDGRHVAYILWEGVTSWVAIATSEGEGERKLVSCTTSFGLTSVNWHPDGDRLIFVERTYNGSVFEASPARDGTVYRSDTNGADKVALTANPDYDKHYATYAPNGETFCYSQNQATWYAFPQNLFVRNADGTGAIQLTDHGNGENLKVFACRFSPDGRTIVYQRGYLNGGGSGIWTVGADGVGDANIIGTTYSNEGPGYTRDGLQIVFSRYQSSRWQLATAGPDGSGVQLLAQSGTLHRVYPCQAIVPAGTVTGGVARIACTVGPAGAASGGALRWRLLSGPDVAWHASGVTSAWLNVSDQPYTVTFSNALGFITPTNRVVSSLVNGGIVAVDVTYVVQGMVLIPGGTFSMGASSAGEGHPVTLSPFYLDAREVTVGEYLAFCTATESALPTAPPWGLTNTALPVVSVTWSQAAAYATWAGKRLPTEAEYEYAMRGGSTNRDYPWTAGPSANRANYGNAVGRPAAAGSYPATGYGVFDIAGNAWEWCRDGYQGVVTGPTTDPTGDENASNRVIRGGSWVSAADRLACAARFGVAPSVAYNDLGFRCAQSLSPTSGVPVRALRLSGDLVFGVVTVGSASGRTMTIWNDGDTALNVTGISYPVGFTGAWSGSVAAGGSQAVTVTFAPTADAAYDGLLTVLSDKTFGTSHRPVSGTGVTTVAGEGERLEWTPTTGATWYYLWLSRNGQTFYRRWLNQTNVVWVPAWNWPSGEYEWWVQPWGAASGLGAWSSARSFTVEPDTLSWTRTDGATAYRLWLNRNGQTYHDFWLNQTNATWQPGWDLDPGQYEWWVQGWSAAAGYGTWAGRFTFTVNGTPMDWEATEGATWYRLWVNRDDESYGDRWFEQTNAFVCATSHLDVATYEWWAQPWSSTAGLGSWTAGRSLTVSGVPWRWAPSSGATWYELWVDKDDEAYLNTWLEQTGTTWSATWEWEAGTYTWWVRPWSPSNGLGSWSEPMIFQIP